MISLSVALDLYIHEHIELVQSRIKHKSSVFSLFDFDSLVGPFRFGSIAAFVNLLLPSGAFALSVLILSAFLMATLRLIGAALGAALFFACFGIEFVFGLLINQSLASCSFIEEIVTDLIMIGTDLLLIFYRLV